MIRSCNTKKRLDHPVPAKHEADELPECTTVCVFQTPTTERWCSAATVSRACRSRCIRQLQAIALSSPLQRVRSRPAALFAWLPGPEVQFACAVAFQSWPQLSSSFSNSFRCRWTKSTSNADTEGRPPYFLA